MTEAIENHITPNSRRRRKAAPVLPPPVADLPAACDRFLDLRARVNAHPTDCEDHPAWDEYVRLERSIIATTARSATEMVAKARAAWGECRMDRPGSDLPSDWARSLLGDILALDAVAA